MRGVMRILLNFLSCRWKLSSKSIIIGMIIFFGGNYIILRSMFARNYTNETKVGHSTEDDGVIVKQNVYHNNRKDNTNEFIESLVDKSQNVGNGKSPHKFNRETEAPVGNENHIDVKNVDHENKKDGKFKIALLIISCNRVEVRRCLDKIFEHKPKDYPIEIIVSQDCGHKATADVIRSYGDRIKFIQQPDLGPVHGVPNNMHRFMGYYKISRHFQFALGKVFEMTDSDSVIIVEDDIEIASDFFDYFLATRKLLEVDNTLFCVSAWNDNGKEDSVDPSAIDVLYRSDFFPGLGWMMTRKLWNEIGPNWPKGFWDDWMRDPKQRKDRSCIRPEISRTKTFGRIGVSQGQFYDQYLKYIRLNNQAFPFRDYDLSYLMKSKYDEEFLEKVYTTPEVDSQQATSKGASDVRITYNNHYEFENFARRFGLMSDFKAGVPRTAYHGVVTFFRGGHRIYIAPPKNWKGYKEH
ncbi:alpha-1,3-mannosyl-glycoprotein 2-beta-N-acetylglucosaminyltransferase-like [Clytia hemisphaerica]|uniref:Alpha-1,3-mannosyl-glycoprotein 2-beta-N-acetylglucosaminyltransferase n=1 Tax=Clytia hemisphaerica TaxID=252671 RepID=A0A7M6DLU4_9CNID